MLSVRLLRCFAAVADELSFTAAAARLNMAQPALTRAIKQLEDQLGGRLLDRNTRNVRLTKMGRAFLSEARTALDKLAHAERVGREMGRGMLGHVKIGYTTFVAHDVLAPLLRQFNIGRPNIRITLSNLGTEQQRIALVERDIDIGFMLGPFSIPTVAVHWIRTDPLVVVMPRDHHLAKKKSLLATDLQGERLVVGTESTWSIYRRLIFSEFNRLGVSPLISQEAPTPSAIIALVSAGLGLTIFPQAYCENFARHLVRRPLLGHQNSMDVICAWNKADSNPSLQALLQYLPVIVKRNDAPSPQ